MVQANIYSFDAEAGIDLERFLRACAKAGVRVDLLKLDEGVEIATKASLDDLRRLMRWADDSHVMIQNLRACPLHENSLSRDFDIDEDDYKPYDTPTYGEMPLPDGIAGLSEGIEARRIAPSDVGVPLADIMEAEFRKIAERERLRYAGLQPMLDADHHLTSDRIRLLDTLRRAGEAVSTDGRGALAAFATFLVADHHLVEAGRRMARFAVMRDAFDELVGGRDLTVLTTTLSGWEQLPTLFDHARSVHRLLDEHSDLEEAAYAYAKFQIALADAQRISVKGR